MRAYVNSRGYVVAVFKVKEGNYQIFIRRGKKLGFKKFDDKLGKCSTRAQAEAAMDKWYKCRCSDKTYELVENWRDGYADSDNADSEAAADAAADSVAEN